jgi:hypothetical protein
VFVPANFFGLGVWLAVAAGSDFRLFPIVWACSSTRIFYSAAAVFVCIGVQAKALLCQEEHLGYCYPNVHFLVGNVL